MSLGGSYSTKLGMSGSYGSNLCLTGAEQEIIQKAVDRKTHPHRTGEEAPLVNGKRDDYGNRYVDLEGNKDASLEYEERMSPILIITIVVVTIGSSLQFGYGTGE